MHLNGLWLENKSYFRPISKSTLRKILLNGQTNPYLYKPGFGDTAGEGEPKCHNQGLPGNNVPLKIQMAIIVSWKGNKTRLNDNIFFMDIRVIWRKNKIRVE